MGTGQARLPLTPREMERAEAEARVAKGWMVPAREPAREVVWVIGSAKVLGLEVSAAAAELVSGPALVPGSVQVAGPALEVEAGQVRALARAPVVVHSAA